MFTSTEAGAADMACEGLVDSARVVVGNCEFVLCEPDFGDVGLVAYVVMLDCGDGGGVLVGLREGVGDCCDGAGAVGELGGSSEDKVKAAGGARVAPGPAGRDGGVG